MRARAFLLILGLLLAAPARTEPLRLTLLHTTDLHGALDGWDYLADRPAQRGLTRIATLVRRVRNEGAPTLLLDAGDAIQGGIEFVDQHGDQARPDPMMSAMSALGYDAMAVGNHEFSFGPERIEQIRRAAHFPWLSANLLRDESNLAVLTPSIVKTVSGVRVGIVGVTTPATAKFEDHENLPGWHFSSPLVAAQLEVARLRQTERCDVVVLLAHTGLERESVNGAGRKGDTPDENWGFRLATEVPGVDVVILGHTHVVIPSRDYYGVLVTQAGKWGEQLGRVDVLLERDGERWKLTGKTARMIAVTDSVADDSALAALAEPYHAAARESLARVVSEASREIDSSAGRAGPGPIWELIHRAQLEASGAEVSIAALPDPGVALAPGPLRLRDVWRLYPYDNTLDVIELTGGELRAALEQSAAAFQTYTAAADRPLFDPDRPLYNFDSAFGVNYEIDLLRAPGDRIRNLSIHGEPLAADRRLKVVVNNYRANGGGGFEMIQRAPRLARITRPVPELIADWLTRHAPLDGSFEVGWRVRPDYAATPERELIDRLVRQNVVSLEELKALDGTLPAREEEGAAWLALAFGRGGTPGSGAAGDSLERRGVPGRTARVERGRSLRAARATEWLEGAARDAHYALAPAPGRARGAGAREGDDFVASLRTSLSPPRADGLVSRTQMLGMISNLRFPTLRVLETTDVHGFILPGARERRTRRPVGGSAALAAWVKRLRAENPEGTILLDGGDWFQGTMISNLQFGRPIVEQMNLLDYTAAAIGNHDFDWTADTLAERAAEMHFAALGANCIVKRTGRRPRYARADTVVTRRGVRIGILGLCYRGTPTVTLPQNVAHLRFEDDSATAARRVPLLRGRGRAQVVVEIGHIPAESDSTGRARGGDLPRLARGVPGVDAWFGGHSHNQVVDEIGGAPVMIAGAHAELVGVVDLTFDPLAGRVIEHRARLQPTYSDVLPPDSAMAARVAEWNEAVAPLAAEPIGRTARRLTRSGENTIGYLVTDAMRSASGAEIALTNSGGLRADLPEGPVTHGEIFEVLPFENTIVTLEMTGAELRQVIEEGLRGGRVLQMSGARLIYDPSRPPSQRVVSLTLADGKPLEEGRSYKIAINNFIATGGDGFTLFARARNLVDTRLTLRDAIEACVKAKSANGGAVDYGPEGRVTRLNGEGRN